MRSALVVSRIKDAIQSIRNCFEPQVKIDQAFSMQEALVLLKSERHHLLFIDVQILLKHDGSGTYKDMLKPLWDLNPSLEVIILTQPQDLRKAVMIVKAGARDYLTYPIDEAEVKHVSESIHDSIIMESELNYLRDKFWHVDSLNIIRTDNESMKAVFEKIRSVAPTKSSVLLMGETGTGKSLMAKLIHQHSNRSEDSFISVHCGAIPETLIESELFGHEKGAFTGAVKRKIGKFEIAKGGTIFLDEIGTISAAVQIKLLQVLQDGAFQRVGGEETLSANARVIAATNSDLEKMCAAGEFRKDLFYRLNVFPIPIPGLRDRLEDLPQICNAILDKLNKFEAKNIHGIDQRVIEAFKHYSWPGNIRELENLIERAYIIEMSSVLTPESFPKELFERATGTLTLATDTSRTLAEVRRNAIEDIERKYIKELLTRNRGRINDSAREAGISTRQLNKQMNRYGIRKEIFKS
jgi:DNA-binding NtrC family response regulator